MSFEMRLSYTGHRGFVGVRKKGGGWLPGTEMEGSRKDP